jgi:hypothetical protein
MISGGIVNQGIVFRPICGGIEIDGTLDPKDLMSLSRAGEQTLEGEWW